MFLILLTVLGLLVLGVLIAVAVLNGKGEEDERTRTKPMWQGGYIPPLFMDPGGTQPHSHHDGGHHGHDAGGHGDFGGYGGDAGGGGDGGGGGGHH